MIQQLFANETNYSSIHNNGGGDDGGGGGGGGHLLQPTTKSSSSCPSSTTTTTTTTTPENLRCPRCDSSNTKFCYYNNYNLTQPRHFCKTCRRYWTKGGALRNVPIGGGCRKNKTIGLSNTASKTTTNKMKTVSSEFLARSTSGQGFDLEHVFMPPPLPPPPLPSSQILWGSPQNSHILSLLRSNQNPNPNNNMMMNSQPLISNGYDGVGHVLYDGGFVLNEQQQQNQNSNIQQLYHKLNNNYCSDVSSSPTVLLGNVASSTTNSSSSISNILETNSVSGGVELGYWNPIPPLTWSHAG